LLLKGKLGVLLKKKRFVSYNISVFNFFSTNWFGFYQIDTCFYIYKSKLRMVWGNKSKANVCKPCDSLVICVLAAA